MALIVDTGPLVAAIDRADPDHTRCARLLADTREQLIVPTVVLVEVEYFLRRLPGAFGGLMRDVAQSAIETYALGRADVVRAGELVETYRDLSLGFVDAAVIATAERLGETRVATLDHRHFRVVRPAHVETLELLP